MFFVGEYFYWNINLAGTIDVGAVDCPYLVSGWSPPRRRPGWPAFRWAWHPTACVRFPLENPLDLRIFVAARAPARLKHQAIGMSLNRGAVSWRALPTDWTDVHFFAPASSTVPGENLLCLHFNERLPGEEGHEVAAAVTKIQLH
jgi:hypothetical protein